MRSARAANVVGALVWLMVVALPGPAAASTPYLTLTLTASPNPSGFGAPGMDVNLVTLTGKIVATGGTFLDVAVNMSTGYPALSCTPAADCKTNIFGMDNPVTQWIFPTVSGTVTVTAVAPARIGVSLGFSVQACNPNNCLVQHNGSVIIKGPTISGSIVHSPAGVIMPGDVLHFTSTGVVNLPPVSNIDIQAKLPAGLGDPTNLSAGVWSSTSRSIDYNVELNPSDSYSFDSQVTAPLGSDLKVVLTLVGYTGFTKTYTLHVGAVATATPRPTPAATVKPPTATPTAVAASPSPTDTPAASIAAETSSQSAASITPSASALSSGPTASAAASSGSSGGGSSGIRTVIVAAGVGGAAAAAGWAGLLVLRRRRPL